MQITAAGCDLELAYARVGSFSGKQKAAIKISFRPRSSSLALILINDGVAVRAPVNLFSRH